MDWDPYRKGGIILQSSLFYYLCEDLALNVHDITTFFFSWTYFKMILDAFCMGTVESQPEPLIDHLRWALCLLWEHRWRQPLWWEGMEPGCNSPRPHLRADCHWGRFSFQGLLLLEFFSVSLQHRWAFSLIFLAVWSVDIDLTTPLCIFVDYTPSH